MMHVDASDYHSLSELLRDCSATQYVFFCHTLCPYAERVWLAFEEQPEKTAALVHVDLSRKPSWFREVSPRGLVPTVVHNGEVHVESMDILEWLLGESVRYPSDVSEVVGVCLDACGGNAGSWRVGTSISQRQLDALERVLVRTLTDDMRLVEKLAVYPFIYRTMVVLKTAYGVDIGGLGDGKVGAWMDDMVHRQSCRTTSADLERFGQAMKAGGLDFFDYRRTSMFEFHPHLDT